MMKLEVCPADAIGMAAARTVKEVVLSKPSAVIGLATGSSPLPLYKALAQEHLDVSNVCWFALDEYVGLPPGHHQSYAEVIRREVSEPLDLDPASVLLPDAQRADLDAAAADYEALIQQAGGIDLQILGIGHNGHLAFNEPGTPLNSRTRVEALAESTRQANARFFPSLDEVPTHCITQGLATILDAKKLLLVVRGADKADILHQALTGPVTMDCPGSVLQLHHDVTVLVDEAAATGLMPAESGAPA